MSRVCRGPRTRSLGGGRRGGRLRGGTTRGRPAAAPAHTDVPLDWVRAAPEVSARRDRWAFAGSLSRGCAGPAGTVSKLSQGAVGSPRARLSCAHGVPHTSPPPPPPRGRPFIRKRVMTHAGFVRLGPDHFAAIVFAVLATLGLLGAFQRGPSGTRRLRLMLAAGRATCRSPWRARGMAWRSRRIGKGSVRQRPPQQFSP